VSVRVIAGRAYHALFMHNLLIRPTKEELRHFKPDVHVRRPCTGIGVHTQTRRVGRVLTRARFMLPVCFRSTTRAPSHATATRRA